MAKRSQKNRKAQTKTPEYVVVTFTSVLEQAKEYEALLKTDNIPVTIKEQNESSPDTDKTFAIMVPEDSLDEAYVIIESQNAYEDFYDFALEEKEDEDFDDDLFEDGL